jgi:hypothetical protein
MLNLFLKYSANLGANGKVNIAIGRRGDRR